MSDISKIKSDRIDDGIKPGDICYSLRTEKTGWLLCDGASYSTTDYPELFAVIGYTFGGSEGNFNVPNYKGKFLQMISDNQSLGQEMEAGLPNITGEFGSSSHRWPYMGIQTGAFSGTEIRTTTSYLNIGHGSSTDTTWGKQFDASLSNSIYGNSTTVQPPASIVNYFIKY